MEQQNPDQIHNHPILSPEGDLISPQTSVNPCSTDISPEHITHASPNTVFKAKSNQAKSRLLNCNDHSKSSKNIDYKR